MLELYTIGPLDKVFPTGESAVTPLSDGVMLQNEVFSFQAVFRLTAPAPHRLEAAVRVTSDLPRPPLVYQVRSVPCELPCLPGQRDALRREAGFFPDALEPLDGESPTARCIPGQWQSLWLMVEGCQTPGAYTVEIGVEAGGWTELASFALTVLPASLPEQTLLATQWLHSDCIASCHGVEVFSEEYWTLLEAYLRTAARFGLNTILTPILTPPLDTAVGTYRRPCQLVEVRLEGEGYAFDFSRLARWVALCGRCGFTHFELSHLFTQWGAKAAPQVRAVAEGEERLLFGWDTPARSEGYLGFLEALLPALHRCLTDLGVQDRCLVHISDEPGEDAMERYAACVRLIRRYLPGYPILDAMGSPRIFRESGIDLCAVAMDQMEAFGDTAGLWGYYCWVQYRGVTNRFFSMPSAVTRIFGVQAYLYRLRGFLHWGYNFYNTHLSLGMVDPYTVTDAGGNFPGGDPFSVYPTAEGCTPSLRLAVFAQGLEDLRALTLLERYIGREAVEAFIREYLGEVTWSEYPREGAALLRLRRELDLVLARRTGEAAACRGS